MAEAVGTPALAQLAAERFREPERVLGAADRTATAWAESRADDEHDELVRTDSHDPRSLLSQVRAAIGRALAPFSVKVSSLGTLAATGEHTVYVARGRFTTPRAARRIALHEVHGHVLPRVRSAQGSSDFRARHRARHRRARRARGALRRTRRISRRRAPRRSRAPSPRRARHASRRRLRRRLSRPRPNGRVMPRSGHDRLAGLPRLGWALRRARARKRVYYIFLARPLPRRKNTRQTRPSSRRVKSRSPRCRSCVSCRAGTPTWCRRRGC